MTAIQQKLDAIQAKQDEAARLRSMLQFYEWLKRHGTSYDQIKGVRKTVASPALWHKIAKEHRPERRPRFTMQRMGLFYMELKLHDGSELVLPWPPYNDDVIFNKSAKE